MKPSVFFEEVKLFHFNISLIGRQIVQMPCLAPGFLKLRPHCLDFECSPNLVVCPLHIHLL